MERKRETQREWSERVECSFKVGVCNKVPGTDVSSGVCRPCRRVQPTLTLFVTNDGSSLPVQMLFHILASSH